MNRFFNDQSSEEVIVNELHFGREARRELEDLSKSVDWKGKEMKKGKEVNEVLIIGRWFTVIERYFFSYTLWNEVLAGLIDSIVQIFGAAKNNHREISHKCIFFLRNAAEGKDVHVEDLFKGGAIDAVLEEMNQSTLNEGVTYESVHFFLNISKRLKGKEEGKIEEKERKDMKRKIFKRMEKEGYEDIATSLYGFISFQNDKYHYYLSLDVSDYFVNV